jgi:hypothetical protein
MTINNNTQKMTWIVLAIETHEPSIKNPGFITTISLGRKYKSHHPGRINQLSQHLVQHFKTNVELAEMRSRFICKQKHPVLSQSYALVLSIEKYGINDLHHQ